MRWPSILGRKACRPPRVLSEPGTHWPAWFGNPSAARLTLARQRVSCQRPFRVQALSTRFAGSCPSRKFRPGDDRIFPRTARGRPWNNTGSNFTSRCQHGGPPRSPDPGGHESVPDSAQGRYGDWRLVDPVSGCAPLFLCAVFRQLVAGIDARQPSRYSGCFHPILQPDCPDGDRGKYSGLVTDRTVQDNRRAERNR